ncbi:Nitrogen permease regulator 3-like protein [Sciurus carolinensis]|uniref:GATOR complex protein NPRL3 n=1 Tax=Sciurus carolinensis TaxID=30640 RepID=A0AA41SPL2_SCICA|nr:Nitrogen permease regulator 3-like protein [Sciurus carolinensis]
MILFNVVFALRAKDPLVINCLHTLSLRIATVLQHEERRCHYLTRDSKMILALQDEVTDVADAIEGPQSPFHHILPKCNLASDLKKAYDSLCTSGVVRFHTNRWLEPTLVRMIKITSAVKNLQQLAQDADLALLQAFQLAAHLVYSGKAVIIYPLCENNVCVLSPNASVCLYPHWLSSSPAGSHPTTSHPSLPSCPCSFPFWNSVAPWLPLQETRLIQMVVWMLQHWFLIQLHTYVCLMASPSEEKPRLREEDVPFTARVGGRSLSTPNFLSFGSPTSSDNMTLTSPSMDNSNPEDLRMFARLLHYFHSHHHLEEIMYKENTGRSQLLLLLDKFRSVLVLTAHEDPVIAVFQALLT